MSEVLAKMKTRRSIRKFKEDMVPQEVLDQIIEAGTYAANGRNAQSPIIIQVTNITNLANLAKLARLIKLAHLINLIRYEQEESRL